MKDPRAMARGLLILLYRFSAQIHSRAEALQVYPDLSGITKAVEHKNQHYNMMAANGGHSFLRVYKKLSQFRL